MFTIPCCPMPCHAMSFLSPHPPPRVPPWQHHAGSTTMAELQLTSCSAGGVDATGTWSHPFPQRTGQGPLFQFCAHCKWGVPFQGQAVPRCLGVAAVGLAWWSAFVSGGCYFVFGHQCKPKRISVKPLSLTPTTGPRINWDAHNTWCNYTDYLRF